MLWFNFVLGLNFFLNQFFFSNHLNWFYFYLELSKKIFFFLRGVGGGVAGEGGSLKYRGLVFVGGLKKI